MQTHSVFLCTPIECVVSGVISLTQLLNDSHFVDTVKCDLKSCGLENVKTRLGCWLGWRVAVEDICDVIPD